MLYTHVELVKPYLALFRRPNWNCLLQTTTEGRYLLTPTRVVFQTAQTLQTHYDPQGQSPMTYEFKWCCEKSYPAKEWIAALSPHFRGKLLSEIHRHGPSLQQE